MAWEVETTNNKQTNNNDNNSKAFHEMTSGEKDGKIDIIKIK